jgi:hypothetical protein
MKKILVLVTLTATALLPASLSAGDNPAQAEQLAHEVWKASGGEHWPHVKTIDFTFAVEKNGKTVMQAEHHWDVAAQTDRVKWKDKDVTVNLAEPGQDADGKAAYERWVNDSYWLLSPLKLRDRGLKVTSEGTKEMDGALREVLRLSFDRVGLTPNDQYRLYIDPATKRVASWDYMPKPGETMHGTWEGYQQTGGLMLATDHKMDGGVQIRILNLKVTNAK